VSEPATPLLHLTLRPIEVQLLRQLVGELRTLVAASEPNDDPLDNWAAELAAPPIDHDDPVIRRLFPSAYSADDLDAEYRRLTEPGLRAGKDADARIVDRDLAAEQGRGLHVPIARRDAEPWLRTLNALRLALATRLGIEADDSALGHLAPDDPRLGLVQVYQWLAYVQESILDALTGTIA
jgi:hypothetical protein